MRYGNNKRIKSNMLSTEVKRSLAAKIQRLLQSIDDDELPEGEIQFILHVDGEEDWSWANIRNNGASHIPAPNVLIRNITKDHSK
jgi:hypothetical protein